MILLIFLMIWSYNIDSPKHFCKPSYLKNAQEFWRGDEDFKICISGQPLNTVLASRKDFGRDFASSTQNCTSHIFFFFENKKKGPKYSKLPSQTKKVLIKTLHSSFWSQPFLRCTYGCYSSFPMRTLISSACTFSSSPFLVPRIIWTVLEIIFLEIHSFK